MCTVVDGGEDRSIFEKACQVMPLPFCPFVSVLFHTPPFASSFSSTIKSGLSRLGVQWLLVSIDFGRFSPRGRGGPDHGGADAADLALRAGPAGDQAVRGPRQREAERSFEHWVEVWAFSRARTAFNRKRQARQQETSLQKKARKIGREARRQGASDPDQHRNRSPLRDPTPILTQF